MRNKYPTLILALIINVSFAFMMPAVAKNIGMGIDSNINKSTLKFKDNRPNRPVFNNVFKTDFDAFMFKMATLKNATNTDKPVAAPKTVSSINTDLQNPIDNVKVYPNPVSDQLNLSYSLKKDCMVTIKILDVLGNEVSTLFNQRLGAGVQNNKFMLDSKLNTGFYFVRIISGANSVVKRISVL